MAQILIRAKNNVHANSTIDRRACYKRGMIVCVVEDAHVWGTKEGLPDFVIIKIPLISSVKIQKYLVPEFSDSESDENGQPAIHRRRAWKLRVDDIPISAKNKLLNEGFLTIKATLAYNGSYDYTWTQVKSYFRNLKTNQDETEEL